MSDFLVTNLVEETTGEHAGCALLVETSSRETIRVEEIGTSHLGRDVQIELPIS